MTPVPRNPPKAEQAYNPRSKTKSDVLVLPRGTPRPCRDFMARTTLVVLRAASSVRRLCSTEIPTFTPSRIHTCSDLLKSVKSYLSQPIGTEANAVDEETQMAFQSIKKLLPESCKCLKQGMLSDLRARLLRPPPALPSDYLAFTRNICSEIFKEGWDRQWSEAVRVFSPSLSSCAGTSRRNGGQLAALAVSGQEAFIESVDSPHGDLEGELLLVDSSGKPRPLTRFGPEAACLRPLHGILYDRISKQPWLLRGDVTAEALEKAGFCRDRRLEEPLTSGDYKSASDNLSIEVAEAILSFARLRARFVPANVFDYAMAAQRPVLSHEGEDLLREQFRPTRGQMMGSYLCFPLLCLQNYIAFRYAVRQSGVACPPVLINGDDILFQGTKEFSDSWMEVVSGLSLEVERSKTSVSCEFGTLNSTLVRWGPNGLLVVKTLRMGMLRECGHPGNLGANMLAFARVGSRHNWMRHCTEFLSWHSANIIRWRACLSDMGFRGRLAARAFRLFRGGRLWWRDDVLHQMKLDPLPPPPVPHNIVMGSEEFVKVDPALVSKEISRDTSRWMSARKWELGASFTSRKVSVAVSARANATRISHELNSWRTPAREMRAKAEGCLRTEFYWNDASSKFLVRSVTGALVKERRSESGTSRKVASSRPWWKEQPSSTEVRIPKTVWETWHPEWFSLEGFCRYVKPAEPQCDVVGSLKESTVAYRGLALKMMQKSTMPVWRRRFVSAEWMDLPWGNYLGHR